MFIFVPSILFFALKSAEIDSMERSDEMNVFTAENANIIIIYDNYPHKENLKTGWGFPV